jgi:hypothetical protein
VSRPVRFANCPDILLSMTALAVDSFTLAVDRIRRIYFAAGLRAGAVVASARDIDVIERNDLGK